MTAQDADLDFVGRFFNRRAKPPSWWHELDISIIIGPDRTNVGSIHPHASNSQVPCVRPQPTPLTSIHIPRSLSLCLSVFLHFPTCLLYIYIGIRSWKHSHLQQKKHKEYTCMRAVNYGLLLLNQYQPSRVSCFVRKIMSGSDHSSGFDQPRLVVKKVLAKPQREGEGAVVRRSIGRFVLNIFFY